MRIIRDKSQIYAYGTTASPQDTLDYIKKNILIKYKCEECQYTEDPDGKKYIQFFVRNKENGLVPIQIDIPEIYTASGRGKKNIIYREKESFRALILLLKAKLTVVDLGGSLEEAFFLNILTPEGKVLKDQMLPKISLLIKGEKLD